MSQPLIGHVDSDCFYVSAERVRYEFLSGVPVGVLGNQGACVIAKSYEMKAAGVKTGEPIWEAIAKCPDGLYVKRDFRWYEVLIRAMLAIVRDVSPKVEYYSIDEFFFVAVPPKGQTPLDYARAIRDQIMEATRVPATVGIARSRTLAKLISDTAKPFGASAVTDQAAERSLLERLPVTEITGIAGRREKKLMPWGIRTCLDLANADRRLVRELLTATGEALWWELNGDPVTPIHPRRPLHKVISRGGSFGEASDRPDVVWAWLVRNVERLIEELHYHEVRTAHISVWLGYRDGRFGEGRASLETPSDRFRRPHRCAPTLPPSGLDSPSDGEPHAPVRGQARSSDTGPAWTIRVPERACRSSCSTQAGRQRPAWPIRTPERRHAAAGGGLSRHVE